MWKFAALGVVDTVMVLWVQLQAHLDCAAMSPVFFEAVQLLTPDVVRRSLIQWLFFPVGELHLLVVSVKLSGQHTRLQYQKWKNLHFHVHLDMRSSAGVIICSFQLRLFFPFLFLGLLFPFQYAFAPFFCRLFFCFLLYFGVFVVILFCSFPLLFPSRSLLPFAWRIWHVIAF